MKVVSSAQMRQIEKIAIEEYGMPEILLMENAAFEVYKKCIAGLNKESSITTVIAGTGNNGGDGLAVARHLFQNGYNVNILIFGSEAKYKN
ncbi:MAG: bifunctional ADP-dependent NAD(P)H-hydrate dehydratase/NAD(P)H-hydrate epimerase, partial [Clostridiales bacterium]|nr:bifunctional ADP-dependent NAD(P)H-hydrate dehydratase/NAD(P)H-hydrate epimerase [Clostridiales bacterium]